MSENILYILSGFVCFSWIIMIVKVLFVQKNVKWARIKNDRQASDKKISVIIPARNEEKDIAESLQSIIHQEDVDLEIIVINDHSNDKTGEIINTFVQDYSNVSVIHDPPLKPGWLGKCNAMSHGLEKATGDYIVFCDADIIHEPRCFISGISEFEAGGYDFYSMLPVMIIKTFWENVLLPMYIAALSQLISPSKLEDPNSKEAVGTGAFMLMKRSALEKIGGLDSIKDEMADDIALAIRIKNSGQKTGYFFGPECLSVQLFKTNIDAFKNTVKNVLLIVEGRKWMTLPVILYSILVFCLPFYLMINGYLNHSFFQISIGFLIYVMQYISFYTGKRLLKFNPFKTLFFPLVIIVVTYSMTRAFYHSLKGEILWRDRKVKVRG